MKKLCAGVLAATLLTGMMPGAFAVGGFPVQRKYTGQFTDVPAGAWYAKDVALCYELGLMSGKSATTFDPNGTVTYAEAAALAARVHEIYHGGDGVFPQGKYWWSGAAEYLAETGVLKDKLGDAEYYDALQVKLEEHDIEHFGGAMGEDFPEDHGPWSEHVIDRQKSTAWLGCALLDDALKEINTIGILPDEMHDPTDYYEMGAEWDVVKQLYRAGVVVGNDRWGTFGKEDSVKRSEIAAILVRLVKEDRRQKFVLPVQKYAVIPDSDADYIGNFSEGLAPAHRCWDWGYLNVKGEWAIKPNGMITHAGEFLGGTALVTMKTASGNEMTKENQLMDREGRVIADLSKYRNLQRCSNGSFIAVEEKDSDAKYGMLDAYGKVLVPFEMEFMEQMGSVVIFRNEAGQYAIYCTDGVRLNQSLYTDFEKNGSTFSVQDSAGVWHCFDADGTPLPDSMRELNLGIRVGDAYFVFRDGKTGIANRQGDVLFETDRPLDLSRDGYLFWDGQQYISQEGKVLSFAEAKAYILEHAFAEEKDASYVLLPITQGFNPWALFDRAGNQVSPELIFREASMYNRPKVENGYMVCQNTIYKLK